MIKLRKTYEDIFYEIEGDDTDLKVIWSTNEANTNSICYPKFLNKCFPKALRYSDKQKEINNKIDSKEKIIIDKQLISYDASITQKSIEINKFKKDNLIDIDLNIEQLNFLSSENLKKLSKQELLSVRENVSLEMLWIQQAIQSRLQVNYYLKYNKYQSYFLNIFYFI